NHGAHHRRGAARHPRGAGRAGALGKPPGPPRGKFPTRPAAPRPRRTRGTRPFTWGPPPPGLACHPPTPPDRDLPGEVRRAPRILDSEGSQPTDQQEVTPMVTPPRAFGFASGAQVAALVLCLTGAFFARQATANEVVQWNETTMKAIAANGQ